jgi:hypothetical protein
MVMAHGLGLLASSGLAPFISSFNEAGLTVLTFDYRHFGASTGMPRQLVDPEAQLADWRAAIATARTLSGVAPTKLVLWGTSFSGGHALSMSATQADISAVIAQVPHVNGAASSEAASTGDLLTLATLAVLDATSASDTSNATVPFVGAPGEAALMTQAGTREAYLALVAPGSSWTNETPARSVLGIQGYSPDAIARATDIPVLMVVATEDVVTPPEPARALARTIGAHLLEVAGGHFDVYTGPGFERVVAEEVAFLSSLGLTTKP